MLAHCCRHQSSGFKTYLGFVLIRYGKTHRHGMKCHEGGFYSQILRNRRHGMAQTRGNLLGEVPGSFRRQKEQTESVGKSL